MPTPPDPGDVTANPSDLTTPLPSSETPTMAPSAADFATVVPRDATIPGYQLLQVGTVKSEEQFWEFCGQFDYTWPIIIGVSWFLISGLLITGLGALAGGATAGRKTDRAAAA